MAITKKNIKDMNLQGKAVIMRVDFNVPMTGDSLSRTITDDTRIKGALPTIQYALDNGVKKLVLMSHLGDPKKEEKKAAEKEGFNKEKFDIEIKQKLSLKPVAEYLAKMIGKTVKMAPATFGADVEKMVAELKEGEILMLENTRFNKQETSKEASERSAMGKELAKGMDIFINDAFGTAHRTHASTAAIAEFLPAAAGLLMEKELNFLEDKVLNSPERPLVAIVGGAKVSSKIGVIENLLSKTDSIVITGGMAFTFLKAMGYGIGTSLVEDDQIETANKIMAAAKAKNVEFLLPIDVMVADKFDPNANAKIVDATEIPDGWMGMDAGPKTIEAVTAVLKKSKTIFWNGPLGVFEFDKFANGTNSVAKVLAELPNALTIIGGGDSVAAVNKAGLADKMSHISTGGGASMELIEGKEMPGVAALRDKDQKCGCGCEK
ncbi:MAG: phosphoglycerate kinase [Brevinema sp.]